MPLAASHNGVRILKRPSLARMPSPIFISLIGFIASKVRVSVSPSKQGKPPVKTSIFPFQQVKSAVVISV